MAALMRKQKGFTLSGLIMGGFVLFFLALLGMKVGPEVGEYYKILKNVKATAHDPALQEASVQQIRMAYLKRVEIDGAGSVGIDDLEITKEGNEIVISFAYPKKIPLFANVSLLIEFAGSSSETATAAEPQPQ